MDAKTAELSKCEKLQQENAQLKADLQMIKGNTGNSTNRLYWENKELKSELQSLRGRLKEIEWVEKYDTSLVILTFCPVCGIDKRHYDFETKTWLDNQHEKDCWLKSEIDKMGMVE